MTKVHIDFDIASDIASLELDKNLYLSKDYLFKAFYRDFYKFIKTHNGKSDLESHNVYSLEDFYKYADYYADNQENCYAMGFSFHKYFLDPKESDTLDKQTKKKFIGYLYQNGKYLDFLNFLVSFFAYWRNDEGCTNFNPYNHADDFFNSSWAALVDTSKLFYFSSPCNVRKGCRRRLCYPGIQFQQYGTAAGHHHGGCGDKIASDSSDFERRS